MRFNVRGKIIPVGTPFELDGVSYPANWLSTPEGREALSAVAIVEAEQPDVRYYNSTEDPNNPGQWIATPIDADVLKARLKAYVAELRWQKETGGIVVGGAAVKTDRESQGLVNGAFALVKDDPNKIIRFKTSQGFVMLDAATMTMIARAVGDHVQECFALEDTVSSQIDAGTLSTFEAVSAAWSA